MKLLDKPVDIYINPNSVVGARKAVLELISWLQNDWDKHAVSIEVS